MHPKPDPVGPGQESVWRYPRPPELQPVTKLLRIVHADKVIAETTSGYRVLETSHPPVYYFPPSDCRIGWLPTVTGDSFCEWKGSARYVDLDMPDATRLPRIGWYYPTPTKRFSLIAKHIAFYAGPLDACYVDDHPVTPQPGGFYGGWITPDVVGPFKGVPGSMGW
ncbi:MAG: DUF427 domain-containing protein [Planctomycetota bacterium]